METLGQRIKACRTRLGLTQYELAAKVDMQQGDISKIERGVIAETTKIAQLAHTLGCHALWLATGKGPSGLSSALPSDAELRSNMQALMSARGVRDSSSLAALTKHPEAEIRSVLEGATQPSEAVIEAISRALDTDPMLLYIPTRHFQKLLDGGQPMHVSEVPAEAWDSFPPVAGAGLGGAGNLVGIKVRGELRLQGEDVQIDNTGGDLGYVLGSGVHDGYALRMDGSDAAPSIRDGQYLVIDESGGAPVAGDLCIVRASRNSQSKTLLVELLNVNERGYLVDVLPHAARRTIRKEDVDSLEGIVAVVSARQWSREAPKERKKT